MEKRKLENTWNVNSWKKFDLLQQPNWPSHIKYEDTINEIVNLPSLILSNEIYDFKGRLKKVAKGEAFLLQGGDCAETFKGFNEENIKNKLKILFQMSTIISYGSSIDVLKVGRMAGQFAKPRSSITEIINGVTLPSYRGDGINDINFTLNDRTPNPKRLIKAYNQSLATINLIKSLIKDEFKNLDYLSFWDNNILCKPGIKDRFDKTITRIGKSLKFLNVLGPKIDLFDQKRFNEFYISHESLILDYEAALTKNSNLNYFNASTHMLWLGDRTRNINSAHVEYLSGLINPIGIKCGPLLNIEDLQLIINKLNPINELGKIVLICRFGNKDVNQMLPKLIHMITKNKFNVIWTCDPMHGNTYQSKSNYKTRNFKTIINELKQFFAIHNSNSSNVGGVHFEFTPKDVTECVGGIRNIKEEDLHINYETACDPRLNHEQSIELAFTITDLINKKDYSND
jgi:3-deoxy-7-phosphoheptulonate synthase